MNTNIIRAKSLITKHSEFTLQFVADKKEECNEYTASVVSLKLIDTKSYILSFDRVWFKDGKPVGKTTNTKECDFGKAVNFISYYLSYGYEVVYSVQHSPYILAKNAKLESIISKF
jgi:hypothetical protein